MAYVGLVARPPEGTPHDAVVILARCITVPGLTSNTPIVGKLPGNDISGSVITGNYHDDPMIYLNLRVGVTGM